ncbi:hypothetical protein [Sphingomonas sp. SRS2]|uniref:hypothetical protein n=1 Tax=Sphingomonas sp. SRS2 TaxID=133190 RepID=UPI00061E4B28|nr:hypothetical protein [Sphingomonas sp. SRS2]KKC24886.1 hypothetical protein WP12_16800 [Sphingomonas sp. SRS2]
MAAALPANDPSAPASTGSAVAQDGRTRMVGAMEPVRFGATGSAMPLDAVIAWVKSAAAGAELGYAEGCLPKWSKVPEAVRDLDDRKIVFAFHDSSKSPVQYVIRRLDKPWTPPPAPMRIAREIPPRDDDQARLLTVLKAYAKKALPCPTNKELALKAGLSDGNRASYLLKCLVADRFISNEISPWAPGRIITILSSRNATSVVEGVKR